MLEETFNATSIVALQKRKPVQAAALQKLRNRYILQKPLQTSGVSFCRKGSRKVHSLPSKVKFCIRLFSLKFPNGYKEFRKSFSNSLVKKSHLKGIKGKTNLIYCWRKFTTHKGDPKSLRRFQKLEVTQRYLSSFLQDCISSFQQSLRHRPKLNLKKIKSN